ncbi:MAG: Holliday junction resolvase RuvX [Candidatus Caenarcaniphilales bacterium]|nr:Holliday junction resolvase RuvX [Candidatus Caenarcaniphilales bacterium]
MEELLKGRYLGLDLGKKKVGIAISDETGIIARALKTVPKASLVKELNSLKQTYPTLLGLVVGLPKSKSGKAEKETKAFAQKLQKLCGLAVYFQDERLTSWDAREILKEQGHKPERIAELEDQMAASLILQSFLDGSFKTVNKPELT